VIAQGIVSVHPRGFGFIRLEGEEPARSAFVPPPDMNPFLAGDTVRCTVQEDDEGRLSASKLELVARSRTRVFGMVVARRGKPHLRVDREVANTDWRLEVPQGAAAPAEGAWVEARIEGDRAVCERILPEDADVAFEQVLTRHELRLSFPEQALATQGVVDQAQRRDLRGLSLVTIDSPYTRDIDDAVCALPADAEGAVRVIVAIADVASVAPEGSALDEEARLRATSCYLPDRVVPMLPERLSEGEASLLPGVERRCLAVELRITPEGEVTSVDVYRGLMRSAARLTYDEVAAFLDRGEGSENIRPVRDVLAWCRTASARLLAARSRRGSMEIESDEAHVVMDRATRQVTVSEASRSTSAHLLIERFMVAANEAVARWAFERGVPVPYRVHDRPPKDAVKLLGQVAHTFGFEGGFGNELSPLALSAFTAQVRGAPSAPAILSVLRGALGSARYTVIPSEHFGLGAPLYLHFTSPIRRYADLLVHRAVGGYLDGQRPHDPRPAAYEALCRHLNEAVRRSERTERDCRRVAFARYMSTRIGQTFEANIVGTRPFGLQVQLVGSLIVGTVAVDSLPGGRYRFVEERQEFTGKDRSYAIGMPLTVKVKQVDEMLGRIELDVV